MGSGYADPVAGANEKSQQSELDLGAFWIMRTEVTNAQYARCVQAGACSTPLPHNTRWNDPTYAEHPVVFVTWHQANQYARWVGGRLPTEGAEWEKACRGRDGRTYPWGNDLPTAELVNFDMNVGDTAPVGGLSGGHQSLRCADMAGNVWEWTSSKFAGLPYDPEDGREKLEGAAYRTIRGGSFYFNAARVRCAVRDDHQPDGGNADFGFRVVFPGS